MCVRTCFAPPWPTSKCFSYTSVCTLPFPRYSLCPVGMVTAGSDEDDVIINAFSTFDVNGKIDGKRYVITKTSTKIAQDNLDSGSLVLMMRQFLFFVRSKTEIHSAEFYDWSTISRNFQSIVLSLLLPHISYTLEKKKKKTKKMIFFITTLLK